MTLAIANITNNKKGGVENFKKQKMHVKHNFPHTQVKSTEPLCLNIN